MNILEELFKMQDLEYKEFQAKLIPNISPDIIIGVRTPQLRTFSKKIKNTSEAEVFLQTLPHEFYEENNLHGFLIESIKDYDKCLAEIKKILPFVDNWATCDLMRPLCFKKHKKELLSEIEKWLSSSHTYTIRFALEMLMTFYLDDGFEPRFLKFAAAVKSSEYYVNMMIAWYFATALAKQYDYAVSYLEEKRLEKWVHNKSIQKALESRRISDEQKAYLKTLKIK